MERRINRLKNYQSFTHPQEFDDVLLCAQVLDTVDIHQKEPISLIYLLGGFQAFNKEGDDITSDFSQKLKHLFLFFLLQTIKDGKGITSQKLDETFWFGMDKENAANNRSVNIRKLRLILRELGEIMLINRNSYWNLIIEKGVFCDYYKALQLINELKVGKSMDRRKLKMLLDLGLKGTLLPNTNTEWADIYKSNFSNSLIEVLYKLSACDEIQKDPKLLLQISDVILIHDNIDEDAIRMKCRILYESGQRGLSKQAFDRFCTIHYNMLNEWPNFEYSDVVSKMCI